MSHTERADDEDDFDPLEEADLEHEELDWEESEWDEIIATTEPDFQAGRFAYNSADYATEEEAKAALVKWFWGIYEEALRDEETIPSRDAPCSP